MRLRLVHFSDMAAISELIRRHGGPAPDLWADRLVQFDPRRRYVVCAMALIDGAERLVGLAAIDLTSGAGEPEALIFDPAVGADLSDVLREVACAAAEAAIRSRAA